MSSFNTHLRKSLDPSNELSHRWSHFRSCVNKVANLLEVERNDLLDQIEEDLNINAEQAISKKDLHSCIEYLVKLRKEHLTYIKQSFISPKP